MKDIFLKKSIHFITKYKDYSKEDIGKLRYGLEGIYLTFYKLIIILICSFLLHIFREVLIFLILFNIIRYPAFGFHASTSLECLIMSLLFIIGLPYLLLHVHILFWIKIGICGICIFCFLRYAPADTVKRPLPNVKKRKIRKLCATGCCVLYSCCFFLLKTSFLGNLFLAAMILETILIHPITYKIFKQPYRNYLNMI